MISSRRKFVSSLAIPVTFFALNSIAQDELSISQRYLSFLNWIRPMTPESGMGLSGYMFSFRKKITELSTLATADSILLHLRMGNIDLAKNAANGLIQWHRHILKNAPDPVKGGLCSEFSLRNGNWIQGDYFYASDNLLAISALLELHSVTKIDRYATTAQLIGRWLEKTLFDGKRLGVWSTNYGPAMQYIRSDGAANNAIHTGMDFLWLSSLRGLHSIEANQGWNQRLDKAIDFYKSSMAPEGCWFDYFQPHRVNQASGNWHWYRNTYLTIGDNTLRSALAAHSFGLKDQTAAFSKWLKSPNGKWLWGYIDPKTCTAKYLPTDTVYYDVVCTGLLRSWYTKTGQPKLAAKCQQALDMLQSENGGWHWGVKESNLQPLNSEQAVVTGCWALADLA